MHPCLARGLGHGRPRQLHCTVPRLEKVSNLVAMCGRPDGQTARWPDESNAACGTRLERGSLLSSETQGSKPGLTTRPRDVKSNCSKTHHCRDWMCVGRTARNSKAPVTKGVTYACFVCFFSFGWARGRDRPDGRPGMCRWCAECWSTATRRKAVGQRQAIRREPRRGMCQVVLGRWRVWSRERERPCWPPSDTARPKRVSLVSKHILTWLVSPSLVSVSLFIATGCLCTKSKPDKQTTQHPNQTRHFAVWG